MADINYQAAGCRPAELGHCWVSVVTTLDVHSASLNGDKSLSIRRVSWKLAPILRFNKPSFLWHPRCSTKPNPSHSEIEIIWHYAVTSQKDTCFLQERRIAGVTQAVSAASVHTGRTLDSQWHKKKQMIIKSSHCCSHCTSSTLLVALGHLNCISLVFGKKSACWIILCLVTQNLKQTSVILL